MIWNYHTNCPKGDCRELSISPESFKKEIEEWLEENLYSGFLGTTEEQCIRSAMESVGYNLHLFMLSHSYDKISNDRLREYFLIYNCLSHSPSSTLIKINSEEYAEGYDVNMRYKADDMRWGKWGDKSIISDSTVYCRLYFCENEHDIWDIFADGAGDIDSLYDYYAYYNENKEKALEAMLYIYNVENKLYPRKESAKPESVRKTIANILDGKFLDDMCDKDFSKDEQDVWNIFADGECDIDNLYDYYMSDKGDRTKALEALLYIYNKTERVKNLIEKILINDFFDGMDDEFFDDANFDNAKLAWDLGIQAIRQEFIRDDHALAMLKRIL